MVGSRACHDTRLSGTNNIQFSKRLHDLNIKLEERRRKKWLGGGWQKMKIPKNIVNLLVIVIILILFAISPNYYYNNNNHIIYNIDTHTVRSSEYILSETSWHKSHHHSHRHCTGLPHHHLPTH